MILTYGSYQVDAQYSSGTNTYYFTFEGVVSVSKSVEDLRKQFVQAVNDLISETIF